MGKQVTVCKETKRNGEPCTLEATGKNGVCWAHDPKNREARRRRAAMGGRAKASKATKALHELLENLTERVVGGSLEPYRGSVAAQLINTRIRLLEYERNARETEEFAERVARLEARAEEERRRSG